jgi:hypothetical protein
MVQDEELVRAGTGKGFVHSAAKRANISMPSAKGIVAEAGTRVASPKASYSKSGRASTWATCGNGADWVAAAPPPPAPPQPQPSSTELQLHMSLQQQKLERLRLENGRPEPVDQWPAPSIAEDTDASLLLGSQLKVDTKAKKESQQNKRKRHAACNPKKAAKRTKSPTHTKVPKCTKAMNEAASELVVEAIKTNTSAKGGPAVFRLRLKQAQMVCCDESVSNVIAEALLMFKNKKHEVSKLLVLQSIHLYTNTDLFLSLCSFGIHLVVVKACDEELPARARCFCW